MNVIDTVSWIPIKNKTIYESEINCILTKNGFAILCYLMVQAHNTSYVRISMKDIQGAVDIKDARTIKSTLNILIDNNYISIENNDALNINILKCNKNEHITFFLNYRQEALDNKEFERMPVDIFNKYIHKINCPSWCLLCTLAVYNNKRCGYAFPKYEHLQNILGISSQSLKDYIDTLITHKLIRLNQDKGTLYEYGDGIWRFHRNNYYLTYNSEKVWQDYINN